MKNTHVVSDQSVIRDYDRFSKYIDGKNALVAQGGGQRGIFTAGVLDAFLLSNFDPFDQYYGTSAGALNLCAFLCRQYGLGKAFITELSTHTEFFNLFSYIRKKQYVNLSWALDRIVDYPYLLDLDMGRRILDCRHSAYAAVTSAETLGDHYLPMLQSDWRDVILASCAIPTLCPQPVQVGHRPFIDGGVSAPIPVQEAWRQGARFIAVIRTECAEESVTPFESESAGDDKEPLLRQPFNYMQNQWQQKLGQWRYSLRQKMAMLSQKDILNGGRWLFGADNLVRMSHLVGDSFDAHLADMLMVHYQTYALTMKFLQNPPDDAFIVQIAPNQPLRSSTLLSKKDDLLHDYAQGLAAGYNFIKSWEAARGTPR